MSTWASLSGRVGHCLRVGVWKFKIGFYTKRPAGEDGSDPHPGYEETRLKDYLDQK